MTVFLVQNIRSIGVKTLIFSIGLVFAICTNGFASQPWQNWQNTPRSDDKFVGKIWSTNKSRFVSRENMTNDLSKARYVLIGETHDNSDHHLLQAWLIKQLANYGKPAIVMEMIAADKKQVVNEYLARPDANPAGLGAALGWEASGWPKWSYYLPIAEALMSAQLRLYPGDAPRPSVRKIGREGLASIDPAERIQLALDVALSPKLAKALTKDIKNAHCDLLPLSMLGPMEQVQRFRDAKLARAMVDAGRQEANPANDKRQAILIAGNGHVRSDRAVPWYLLHQDQGASVRTVMLIETGDDIATINEMIIKDPDGTPAADYFWFTPQASREDQCEKLRQRFKK